MGAFSPDNVRDLLGHIRTIAENTGNIAVSLEHLCESAPVQPKEAQPISAAHFRSAVEQMDMGLIVVPREVIEGIANALAQFGWFGEDEPIPGADLVDALSQDSAARRFLNYCQTNKSSLDIRQGWVRGFNHG